MFFEHFYFTDVNWFEFKALSPIEVTELGIVIDVNWFDPKPLSEVTELGIVTDVNWLSSNAPYSIVVTELGIIKDVNWLRWKAYLPIEVTESGIITEEQAQSKRDRLQEKINASMA